VSRLDLVRQVHRSVDEAIRHLFEYGTGPDGEKVVPTCGKRCSACCYEPVLAERSEVTLIGQRLLTLDPEVRARVLQRVRDWLARFRDDPQAGLEELDTYAYRRLRLACPLLEDGLCLVYKERPTACRGHVALGPVERCDDDAQRPGQVFMANFDFKAAALMKLAGGLAEDGRAELLFDHLGVMLAEALLGVRFESAARTLMPIVFEDERVEGEATGEGGTAASVG
jgi:Fe-S-cluster containining protein